MGSAKFGAGVKPGISSPGLDWYFGYGSILSGDQSFISVADPLTQTAHLTATVFTGSGPLTSTLKLSVARGQRGTFEMDTLLAGVKRALLPYSSIATCRSLPKRRSTTAARRT